MFLSATMAFICSFCICYESTRPWPADKFFVSHPALVMAAISAAMTSSYEISFPQGVAAALSALTRAELKDHFRANLAPVSHLISLALHQLHLAILFKMDVLSLKGQDYAGENISGLHIRACVHALDLAHREYHGTYVRLTGALLDRLGSSSLYLAKKITAQDIYFAVCFSYSTCVEQSGIL